MMNKKKIEVNKGIYEKARKKYVKYSNYGLIDHLSLGACLWFVLFVWNTLVFGTITPQFDRQDAKQQNLFFSKKIDQRVRDLFNPISNGWYTSLEPDVSFKYHYDEKAKGEFKPRVVWYVNVACLLVAAYWTISLIQKKLKQKHANKIQERMIDMMLKMPLVGYDIKRVEAAMKIAPEIVSHMSQDHRIYFDMLKNGDIEITKNKAIREMAVEIMVGHLQSHPKDMERAVLICAKNNIPMNVLNDIKQIQK